MRVSGWMNESSQGIPLTLKVVSVELLNRISLRNITQTFTAMIRNPVIITVSHKSNKCTL